MNAPLPARLRYMPIVESMTCPGDDEAKNLRCSILLIRDRASQTLRHCGDDANEVLQSIERLATKYAFIAMPNEKLKLARHSLLRLVTAASGFEGIHGG